MTISLAGAFGTAPSFCAGARIRNQSSVATNRSGEPDSEDQPQRVPTNNPPRDRCISGSPGLGCRIFLTTAGYQSFNTLFTPSFPALVCGLIRRIGAKPERS